ncbi:MAG: polymerase sigma-70 factor, subfamily [Alphaproteobacteria bacterium]|jgi:RNA polymerase sigma-70 factor (ECF subfamily)|nr:polymerase sigma-70 factor, subfamily [Alphaproteobacteria bacterium]
MSEPDDSTLNQTLASFLDGDTRAGAILFAKTKKPILAVVRARVPDLRNDHDDIVSEVFVLMMESSARFDPARGSALSYIKAVLVPEAIRRVRAKSARPGSKTRRAAPKVEVTPTFPMLDPAPEPESVPIAGYGSAEAMEAACDAHLIWLRAPPPIRLTIVGLMDGQSLIDMATEMKIDRFKVARRIKALRQFANAA